MAILMWFVETSVGRAILVSIVLTLGIAGAWGYVSVSAYNKGYNKGWDAAIAAVAAKNKEAVKDAERVKTKVKDCFDSGGDWDVVNGKCMRQ